MRSKSQGVETNALTVQSGSIPPPSPQPVHWLTYASFAVALFALVRTWFTDNRAKRLERDSRFESAYGSHLRAELRKFSEIILKFRAYTFASGADVAQLKREMDEFRVELEYATGRLQMLLEEMDKAETVKRLDWESNFIEYVKKGELILQSIAHNSIDSVTAFRAKAEDARQEYQHGIDAVRRILDDERVA